MNNDANQHLADYIACRVLPDNSTRQSYMFMTQGAFCAPEATNLWQNIYLALSSITLSIAANFLTDAIKRKLEPNTVRQRVSTLLIRTEYDKQLVVYRKAIDKFEKRIKNYPDELDGDPSLEISQHRSLLAILSDKEKAAPHLSEIIMEFSAKSRWGRCRYLRQFKRDDL